MSVILVTDNVVAQSIIESFLKLRQIQVFSYQSFECWPGIVENISVNIVIVDKAILQDAKGSEIFFQWFNTLDPQKIRPIILGTDDNHQINHPKKTVIDWPLSIDKLRAVL